MMKSRWYLCSSLHAHRSLLWIFHWLLIWLFYTREDLLSIAKRFMKRCHQRSRNEIFEETTQCHMLMASIGLFLYMINVTNSGRREPVLYLIHVTSPESHGPISNICHEPWKAWTNFIPGTLHEPWKACAYFISVARHDPECHGAISNTLSWTLEGVGQFHTWYTSRTVDGFGHYQKYLVMNSGRRESILILNLIHPTSSASRGPLFYLIHAMNPGKCRVNFISDTLSVGFVQFY